MLAREFGIEKSLTDCAVENGPGPQGGETLGIRDVGVIGISDIAFRGQQPVPEQRE